MNTVLLTVRSKNGAILDAATPKVFVVDRIGTVEANLNSLTAMSWTEAGDAANQMSLWAIYGTGQKLYWSLKLNAAGDREVSIYSDSTHNLLVSRGSLTGDGIVYFFPVNQSGIYGNVTVAYSATDDDAANTLINSVWAAYTDTQLPGSAQFDYAETNGAISKYTVDETYSAINSAISAATSTVTSVTGSLSTAQITILNGTPVVAIPSPGAGYAIQILGGAISYTYGVAQYSVNTTIDLINTTTTANILAKATTAVVGAASKKTQIIPAAGSVAANEGVSLKMNSGDPTVGAGATGTCTYNILYTVYAI